MKHLHIFQALDSSSNVSIANNQTWYRNLYEPLVEMGHDVFLFPTSEGRRAFQKKDGKARAIFSQKLLDAFRKEHAAKHFDLFFSYLIDGMVEPGVIDEIRKEGVPTCNFSCNNAHQFYLVGELSPHFDFNLHSEKDAREKFLAIGANALWWPMASNPKYFKPYDLPRTQVVSFVGANYALRARYISHLLENGVDVHAFGPGWQWGARTPFRSITRHYLLLLKAIIAISPRAQAYASALLSEHDFRRSLSARFPGNLHGPVTDEELIKLYSTSHISMGFIEVFDRYDPSGTVTRHLHLREFEAPMSGALYCTGYMDELAEFFEPDREVLMYRNEQELIDKVRFYFARPDQAEAIRKAGHRRALANHTYHARFQKLFSELGIEK